MSEINHLTLLEKKEKGGAEKISWPAHMMLPCNNTFFVPSTRVIVLLLTFKPLRRKKLVAAELLRPPSHKKQQHKERDKISPEPLSSVQVTL